MQVVDFNLSFFAIFLAVMFLAFGGGLVSRLFSSRSNSSVGGWFVLLGLALFGMFLFALLTVRQVQIVPGEEIAVVSTPLPPQWPPVYDVTPAPSDASERLPHAGAVPHQTSIDELWKQLTAPRINLDNLDVAEEPIEDVVAIGPSSPQEMTDAAKVILSASVPGADPFTQGWLVNAAKSILGKAPRGEASAFDATAASPTRPEWVSDPAKLAVDVHRVVVSTEPLRTIEECRDQLEKRLRFAVADRVRYLAKQATGQSVDNGPMLSEMGVTPDYILRELCPEGTYVDAQSDSLGEMKRAYALIEFTPQKDEMLFQRWKSAMESRGLSVPIVSPLSEPWPQVQTATTVAASSASGTAKLGTSGGSGAGSLAARDRPEWVVNPPKQIGNVRKFVVVSDPFVSVEECRRDADRKMQNLALNRASELSGAATRRMGIAEFVDLGLGADYPRRELCTDEFVDTIDSSVGEMKQVYALLEFNESQDALLVDRARWYSRQEGLQDVSLLGGGLLASVATLFGLLKVDTWTRGYYTKRLFLGVPAAIIGVLILLWA
jgi:hypothetical protein